MDVTLPVSCTDKSRWSDVPFMTKTRPIFISHLKSGGFTININLTGGFVSNFQYLDARKAF